jgi:hypothetical protein
VSSDEELEQQPQTAVTNAAGGGGWGKGGSDVGSGGSGGSGGNSGSGDGDERATNLLVNMPIKELVALQYGQRQLNKAGDQRVATRVCVQLSGPPLRPLARWCI